MILNKATIDTVKLTRRPWHAYDGTEVDSLLDEIATAAEQQQRELSQLRIANAEYAAGKNQITQVLLIAQQAADTLMADAQRTADSLIEQTQQQCDAALATLQQQKSTLLEDVASLRRYKVREIERIRSDLMQLLDDAQPAEPIVLAQFGESSTL